MRFSVDQESVSDIISALTSYSDDIDSEFRKFEEEIKKIAIKTNYNKLLYALQGIIDIYNDVICGSVRKQLIAQWIEEGESLHSFAEDVYMGEESEEAVKKIENSLEEIFIKHRDNNLVDLEFSGDSNATREDFDDAVRIFESFVLEVERIKDNNSDYFDARVEDNELYRFLIPIIESIGIGLSSFSSSAKIELDRLGDNYIDRMEGAKQRVEEAKKEKAPVEFDLDLFDFDDDVSVGGTISNTAGALANSASEVEANKNKSIEHIKNIGRRMQQDFAPLRTDRKPIAQVIEYVNADNLVNDILGFSIAECRLKGRITNDYRNELTQLEIDYKIAIQSLNTEYNRLMSDCYKSIEKKLNEARKSLERSFIKRAISYVLGIDMYQISVNRANALYSKKTAVLQNQYNAKNAYINAVYNRRRQIKEEKKQELFSTGVISKCKSLYDKRETYAKDIQNGIADAEDIQNGIADAKKNVKTVASHIAKECKYPCRKFVRIYQDVYLSLKPNVLGFSCEALGHRITINEKKKTWIDANLSAADAQRVSVDGILNMKTPVHEYLHYLSNGTDRGTSGVRNMKAISEITDDKSRKLMFDAMTGFNEGITEMFAQDYLRDEIASNNNFINPNEVLNAEKNIVRKQNSYDPQVAVIRSICKVLGGNNSVKEAYIKHDFSIVESEITKVLSQSGKNFDWEQVRKDMAEIQRCYTDKNPNTRRQSASRAQALSQKIVEMLEA